MCDSRVILGSSQACLPRFSVAVAVPGASVLHQGMQPGMDNQGFQRIFVTYFCFCCSVCALRKSLCFRGSRVC